MRNIGRKTAMNIEKKLYQWDTEQKLTGCTGLYVDFPIGNEVYRVETADGTCIIPDELLQTSGSHKVYECMTNNTIRSFAFSVTPRPKPPDYVYTPTERLTFEGLVQRVDDAVADMIRRAESGEFDGHTPVKGTDYFTTGEIQQIQNEVSSGAIGEFKSVVDTETETFNTNAESKLITYNENDVAKTGAYNTNASDKLDDYNTNASNKVTEYNSNAENKTAEFDTHTEQIQADISELKSDLAQLSDVKIGNNLLKPTNLERVMHYYDFNDGETIVEYSSNVALTKEKILVNGGNLYVRQTYGNTNNTFLVYCYSDTEFLGTLSNSLATIGEAYRFTLKPNTTHINIYCNTPDISGSQICISNDELSAFEDYTESKIISDDAFSNDTKKAIADAKKVDDVTDMVHTYNYLNPSLLKKVKYYYDFNDGETKVDYGDVMLTEEKIDIGYSNDLFIYQK